MHCVDKKICLCYYLNALKKAKAFRAILIIDIFTIVSTVLLISYQFELPLRQELEEELFLINQLRSQEREQYYITKESIETINRKCHDLKYQIHKQ